ncbi:MAG: type II toxin-antitoxin system prevent-host-death family antitoxin [Oscillospiraceae bacterium]|jgi:prevent-host-death family protein|nr:type II toxin-antitoxin system prevent-host-death family antitoxin [Oscillospiraceae bacterium]
MIVNSTDIQNDFGKYLDLAAGQEILITRNGAAVARLIGIKGTGKSLSEQLRGILPADVDEKTVKDERMSGL